jgi:hypothetical protein
MPCGQSLDRRPGFVTVGSCAVDDPKYVCALLRAIIYYILYAAVCCAGAARGYCTLRWPARTYNQTPSGPY